MTFSGNSTLPFNKDAANLSPLKQKFNGQIWVLGLFMIVSLLREQ